MKLPKQWRRWCRQHGLRPESRPRRPWSWFYLRGHGHVWRVNALGYFQRGDTYAEFDRWALCEDVVETPMPATEREFSAFVRSAA